VPFSAFGSRSDDIQTSVTWGLSRSVTILVQYRLAPIPAARSGSRLFRNRPMTRMGYRKKQRFGRYEILAELGRGGMAGQ
jgi:hypothetical protein